MGASVQQETKLMLKYLIPTILLSTGAFAQEVPPFYSVQACGTLPQMAKQVKEYGEEILFKGKILQQHISGQLVNTEFVFSTNQDTGSWTMISLYPNGWSCLVGNGTDFEPFIR
jgi:hypothetical protein